MTDLTREWLLPCPFCGCTTIVKATGPRVAVPYYECDWCMAEGPAELPDDDPPQGWNVRTAASPDLQELLREARAEGMEMAANLARRLASDGEREADKPSTTANQKIGLGLVRDAARTLETAIRAAAATIRKGEKP